MADIGTIVDLVDKGLDTNFAASVAGLSLAAAAFFSPAASTTVEKHRVRIKELEKLIGLGERRGYVEETEYTNEQDRLKNVVDQLLIAQNSLLKAFLIFVGFVAYTITVDQALDETTVSAFSALMLGLPVGLPLHIADLAVSVLVLSIGGRNLWKGARGIGDYFNISFQDELDQVDELKAALRSSLERVKKLR